MVDDKGIGLSFVMLFVTALVIVGVMQAVSALVGPIGSTEDTSDASVLDRIRPVGQLNTGAPIVVIAGGATAPAAGASSGGAAEPAATKASARSGEQVFKNVCQACHATGAAGAPKVGDKSAWSPRIKQGLEVLVTHALSGFTGKSGTMPPRGTCGNCSEGELKAAVEYMVSKSK